MITRKLPQILAVVLFLATMPACVFIRRARNQDLGANVAPGDQPDKILFQKAQTEIDKGRYDVGRLTLQVLINTYPDSEFLSKAKLLTAQSYYKEGGVSGLTQAENEYLDFITFFPTAPEAPQAEYLAGMCHFRLMGKPDRDLTEARNAEAVFKTFLDKYPDNSLVPLVKGRLREVQEVLADGDFDTARLYYHRGAMRAASSRFQEIADTYPDYSQADQALWYMGQSLEKLRKPNEAAAAYARILSDYPLSDTSKDAKARLVAMNRPIPKPTKAILARAEADRVDARDIHHSLLSRLGESFSSAPDLSATRHGPVILGQQPALALEAQRGNGVGSANIVVEPLSDSSSPNAAGATSDPAATAKPAADSEPGAAPPAASSKADVPPKTAPGAAKLTEAGTASVASNNKAGGDEAKDSAGSNDAKDTGSSESSPGNKKKGKLHFLRKLVPPF